VVAPKYGHERRWFFAADGPKGFAKAAADAWAAAATSLLTPPAR